MIAAPCAGPPAMLREPRPEHGAAVLLQRMRADTHDARPAATFVYAPLPIP